ncbi:hypothetical protein ACFYVD_17945 [Rhodococcus pyridinivorans]|uniref:hypothetical protein n=1 Tax=Rhodococcus pyridinivorans TaxID=103816 RepID=UPI003685B720
MGPSAARRSSTSRTRAPSSPWFCLRCSSSAHSRSSTAAASGLVVGMGRSNARASTTTACVDVALQQEAPQSKKRVPTSMPSRTVAQLIRA